MPTMPEVKTFTGNSADAMNAARNLASAAYREAVPVAVNTDQSIREVGQYILGSHALRNEFIENLWNQIGKIIFTSKMYSNNLAPLKKGMIEFGEAVEEVFVELAKVADFDPENSYANELKRTVPDVRTAFHIINYQKVYRTSTSLAQLKQAFLNVAGVRSLVERIVSSLYSSAAYDEQQVFKYMTVRQVLDGGLKAIKLPELNKANASDVVTVIKGASDDMEFMGTEFNLAGVHNFTGKEDQFLILTNRLNRVAGVNVLAVAFNMGEAEFDGRHLRVDGFEKLDKERLDMLLGGNEWYQFPTEDELALLKNVPAVLIDETWFQSYDNLDEYNTTYVGDGLYWNHRYHLWKTLSTSPYSNAVVFTTADPAVTGVTVSPSAVTATAGQKVAFKADVATTGFERESVVWTVTGAAEVDASGVVSVPSDAAAAATYTVTATSTADGSKTGTATITVA